MTGPVAGAHTLASPGRGGRGHPRTHNTQRAWGAVVRTHALGVPTGARTALDTLAACPCQDTLSAALVALDTPQGVALARALVAAAGPRHARTWSRVGALAGR